MTLNQLEYFRVMADVLHYTKAAVLLHISQPSLSYALAQLETELGVPLFWKRGKQVFLTPFGESFKLTTSNTLLELERGVEKLTLMKECTKREIRLGYIQSLSSSFIPNLVDRYYEFSCTRAIPFSFLPNQQCDLIGALKNNRLDVVFCAESDNSLNHLKVAEQELSLVVAKGHPFALRGSVSLHDLDRQPLVMLQKRTGLYKTLTELFGNRGVAMSVVKEAPDYSAAISYVSLGLGIAILPRAVTVTQPNVVSVAINDIVCRRPIYALWDGVMEDDPGIAHFIDFVGNHYFDGGLSEVTGQVTGN